MSSNQLLYSIKQLLKAHSKGSYQTQSKRLIELSQMAHDLKNAGYDLKHVKGLKPKHIDVLVTLWKKRDYSAGTMKNKSTQLRWWTDTIGKANIMPSNDALGLERRCYISTENKAIRLTSENTPSDPLMRVYLELEQHLGLRREEAMKIKPHLADKGTYLELQGSWTKGGRPRCVPILTDQARAVIDAAKLLAQHKGDSLIPPHKSYKEQLYFYKHQLTKHNIHNAHGFRHAYAQDRYKTLTGWECPKNGGLKKSEMNEEQKRIDREARLQISSELGHSRIEIVKSYI